MAAGAATAGASRVPSISCVCVPSPLPRWDRWVPASFASPATLAFPKRKVGRLPHHELSRPAQRSLTLRPTNSRSRHSDPFTPKALTASLPPRSLRLLPARTIVAGRDCFPPETDDFHGALSLSSFLFFPRVPRVPRAPRGSFSVFVRFAWLLSLSLGQWSRALQQWAARTLNVNHKESSSCNAFFLG